MFTQKKLQIEIDLVTGIDFQLQEYLYFTSEKFGELRTMTSSDGISGPQITSNIIPRFGPYLASGILHDGAFRDKLEKKNGDVWFPWTIELEKDCNLLIEEALESEGCSWLEREIIYNALQLFGWHAFDDDRKAANQPTQKEVASLVKATSDIA